MRKHLIALMVCATCAVLLPVSAARGSGCPPGHAHDYMKAVHAFPAIHRVPTDGRLPFAPLALRLSAFGDLTPGGGRSGFSLASSGSDRKYRLGWTLELVVRRVSSSGQARSVVQKRSLRLSRKQSFPNYRLNLFADLPPNPAFYRLDLSIKETGGGQLARFSEYARVVPIRVNARLGVRPRTLSPGDAIATRVENLGTTWLAYGLGVSLEQHREGRWFWVPQEQWFPENAIEIPAGALGDCERTYLPDDLSPGSYRLTKQVSAQHKSRRAYSPVFRIR
jgi:hypothetical protein